MAGVSKPNYLVTIAFFMAVATLCLLLSTLSVPFDKSLHVFRLSAWSGGTMRYVDFGVFGYCPVLLDEERGHGDNPFTMYHCSKSTLGWEIGKDVVDLLMAPDILASGLPKSWTIILILYPIATTVAFLAFLVVLAVYCIQTITGGATRGPPVYPGQLRLLFSFIQLALSCTLAALFGHISILARMRERVNSLHWANWSLEVNWGNVIFVNILACILLCSALVYTHKLRKGGVDSSLTPTHDPEIGLIQGYEMDLVAPAYKVSTSEGLIDVAHTEPPPSYTVAVQNRMAAAGSSHPVPFVTNSDGPRSNVSSG